MPYPDQIHLAALDALGDVEPTRAECDAATLQYFRARVDALQAALAAWNPDTFRGDNAHDAISSALEAVREAIAGGLAAIEEVEE